MKKTTYEIRDSRAFANRGDGALKEVIPDEDVQTAYDLIDKANTYGTGCTIWRIEVDDTNANLNETIEYCGSVQKVFGTLNDYEIVKV